MAEHESDVQLSDEDLEYLVTFLRTRGGPTTTAELIQALRSLSS